ncbi:hypothetical protein M083_3345 [Bacteroides fragilis str. 3986 T(B)9]|nr:hypothetical protein M145_3203 [Bacteroides fragilis str. 34-F-2 \
MILQAYTYSLYSIFKQSNIHFIHLIPFFRIFASNGTF